MQPHLRITEALLYLLNGLMKLNLGVGRAEIPDALGVHKDHVLLTALKSIASVSSNTCAAERPIVLRYVKRPAQRFLPSAVTSPWFSTRSMRWRLPVRSETYRARKRRISTMSDASFAASVAVTLPPTKIHSGLSMWNG